MTANHAQEERMVDWMVGEGITPVDPAAKIRPDKSLVTANHAWLEVVRVPSNIAQNLVVPSCWAARGLVLAVRTSVVAA